MSITLYKTVFSEYHRGPTSFIHLLSKPVATKRDTAIHQDDIDKLKEATINSVKNISTTLVFSGTSDTDKSKQVNHLAYQTKQSVCFVDCQLLVDKYIGETEKNLSKLIAQAESKDWILFFDEADALFGKRTEMKDKQQQYANQQVNYLCKRLSQYPGLSILSLNEKTHTASIEHLVNSIITIR